MKKLFYILGIAFLSYQCTTDPMASGSNDINKAEIELEAPTALEVERVGDSLFISYGGSRGRVNPNEVLVRLNPGVATTKQKLEKTIIRPSGYMYVQVPEDVDVEKYVSQLKESGEFSLVEYTYYWELHYSPNDAELSRQWYLDAIDA